MARNTNSFATTTNAVIVVRGFDSNRACAPLKAENEIIKLNIDEKLNWNSKNTFQIVLFEFLLKINYIDAVSLF